MPNNIIDKIQLSGVTYDIGGSGGSGVSVVEVTQAEYNALPSSAKTDTSKMYVITDAEAGDLTNYYTKTETNTLLAGKQDTLSAGTNITIVDNVISAEGGGKAISAGTNISITTGETADTINCTLNAKNGTGASSIIFGNANNISSRQFSVTFGSGTQAKGIASIAEGEMTQTTGWYCHSSGYKTLASGKWSNAEGYQTTASTQYSHTEGIGTKVTNNGEHSQGMYNTSSSDGTTSGNTLFSVGNGTADNARHNAFEVRQNGDIYLSSGGTDIKLQDHLGGGGSGTVSSAITSGDTNAVAGGAVYDRFDEVEQVTAQALNVLNEALSGKQDTLSAGTNITISGNVISASGGGKAIKAGRGITVTTGETADTISFSLPISDGTGMRSIIEGFETLASGDISHAEGFGTLASGEISHAEGYYTTGSGESSHAEGYYTIASGASSHAEGYSTIANGILSHAEGYSTIANNYVEHASGKFNVSTSASTTFGDSGNTLFSVGNGTANDARHNAFEIRQNGDIYFEYDGADTKLQDKFDEVEQVTARALIDLNDALSGKVNNSAITTTITSASTDSEIPSAKAVYDVLGDVETLLSQI